MKWSLLLCFLLCFSIAEAQEWHDDFSDSNFTAKPVWHGTDSAFIVNSYNQLQLNDTIAGSSYLSTPSIRAMNTTWEFYINIGFSPSSTNYSRVFLVSDTSDLRGDVHGYYVQLGEKYATDGVDLFRKDGSKNVLIMDGLQGHAAKSHNALRVKVVRDTLGEWTVFSDTLGGRNFLPEGQVFDDKYTTSKYFGIYAKYSRTHIDKFSWDDFSVSRYSSDSTPPNIVVVKAITTNQLKVSFSEPLQKNTGRTPLNYSLLGYSNPTQAQLDSPVFSNATLTFSKNLPDGRYKLAVQNIRDRNSNMILPDTFDFVIARGERGDLVIDEIMADPDPAPSGLPDKEYIEIHNNSALPIALENWTLSDATTNVVFPIVTIQPDSFIIVTALSNASFFTSLGKVVGINGFPILNNPGDELILRNKEGIIISYVNYADTWYGSSVKQDGGWSLEMIDMINFCGGQENWAVSINPKGGTPGRKNSIDSIKPDKIPPTVLSVSLLDSMHVQVFFSEPMDEILLDSVGAYTVNGLKIFDSAKAIPPTFQSVILKLFTPALRGQAYKLGIAGQKDCSGHIMQQSQTFLYAISDPIDSFDVVINEILFNPVLGSSDFVELYNRSNKIIDLKDLYITSVDDSNNLKDFHIIAPYSNLLLPHDYMVLTENPDDIKHQYFVKDPEKLLKVTGMPSYNDDQGKMALVRKDDKRIDQVNYSDKWHFALIANKEGVSLEKINPDLTSNVNTSWHSAASTSGYATPTYLNSQFSENKDSANNDVWIDPPLFSPDGDGYQDILAINYKMKSPGFRAKADVYDSRGRFVRSLSEAALFGTDGRLTWDGTTLTGEKAPIGIYIILVSTFNLTGETKAYKLSCTLAGKF